MQTAQQSAPHLPVWEVGLQTSFLLILQACVSLPSAIRIQLPSRPLPAAACTLPPMHCPWLTAAGPFFNMLFCSETRADAAGGIFAWHVLLRTFFISLCELPVAMSLDCSRFSYWKARESKGTPQPRPHQIRQMTKRAPFKSSCLLSTSLDLPKSIPHL